MISNILTQVDNPPPHSIDSAILSVLSQGDRDPEPEFYLASAPSQIDRVLEPEELYVTPIHSLYSPPSSQHEITEGDKDEKSADACSPPSQHELTVMKEGDKEKDENQSPNELTTSAEGIDEKELGKFASLHSVHSVYNAPEPSNITPVHSVYNHPQADKNFTSVPMPKVIKKSVTLEQDVITPAPLENLAAFDAIASSLLEGTPIYNVNQDSEIELGSALLEKKAAGDDLKAEIKMVS